MKSKILLLIIFLSFYQLSEAQVPTEILCNKYEIQLVEDYGCGNFKFRKDCDLETIWEWGDGTSPITSKEEFVMHKFCKAGRYLVTIKLKQSPSIIRYQLYVDVYDDATLNYTYTILSQVDCDKSVVKFESFTNCIESYDLDGILIPGSDQIMWDFGDGTTSTDLHPKHTFTSGGNFHVSLNTVSSPCELETQKVVPLGDPVTCCLDNVVFDYINWQLNDSEEYTGATIKVKNSIRIKPGVELSFLNTRLEMGKDAKIIVERGASLTISNSTITTTSCGGYVWEGIEVWGGGDFVSQEGGISPLSKTGYLYIVNSTIEHADEAITVAKKRSNDFFDIEPGFNGGYINVSGNIFRNNYTSINLWPYKYCPQNLVPEPCKDCSKFENSSKIDNNSFICNAPMRDEKYTTYASESSTVPIRLGIHHFIYINSNYKLKLLNNDFVNSYLGAPIKMRGDGIVLVNSSVQINQRNVTIQKRIRGLTTGVRVSADNALCRMSIISDYLFSACQVAIDANSTALEVINNQISIPNTISPITAQGIHTRNCKDFKIRNNVINGISVGNKYGVLLRNNRSGELINNTFNNLFVGSQSEFLNNGIMVNCNFYQNQNFSLTVPNGRIANQGSTSLAAGNEFMDACKSISQNLNHIRSNVKFDYFYFPNGNQNPICKSIIVASKTSSIEADCDYTTPEPPCSPNCTKDIYVQNINNAYLTENVAVVNRLKLEMQTVLLNMEGGYEVYKTYLDSLSVTDIEAAMVLASTYYADGKFNELNVVNERIAQFNTEEANSYVQLMEMLKNAALDNRGTEALNEEEILMLNELSMNDTTNAAYIAEALLYQNYEYDYNHNPLVFTDGNRTSKTEDLETEELLMYPNPTSNFVNIESVSFKINSVYIYNVLGELVYSEEINTNAIAINTHSFPKGMYLVKINREDKILSKKLIIE
jgi:hypothetical protein